MTTIGNVGGIQDPNFLNLIAKPQAYSAPVQQVPSYNQQPAQDTFGEPEKKKGGFGKFLLSLVVIAGAVVGGNRLARSKGWISKAAKGSEKFVDKLKNASKDLDTWTMKQVESIKGWFNKNISKKVSGEAPKKADGPDAPDSSAPPPEEG